MGSRRGKHRGSFVRGGAILAGSALVFATAAIIGTTREHGLWMVPTVAIGTLTAVVALVFASLSLAGQRQLAKADRKLSPAFAIGAVTFVALGMFAQVIGGTFDNAAEHEAAMIAAPVRVTRPDQTVLPRTGADGTALADTGDRNANGTREAPFLPGTAVRLRGWEVALGAPVRDDANLMVPVTITATTAEPEIDWCDIQLQFIAADGTVTSANDALHAGNKLEGKQISQVDSELSDGHPITLEFPIHVPDSVGLITVQMGPETWPVYFTVG